MSKLQMVWLEVEHEVFRVRFSLHIYCFVCTNGCIAIQVVVAPACNLWDLGSSLSGTLLIFSTFLLSDFLFFAGRWASLGPFCFYFYLLTPYFTYTPLAQFVLFYFFISFYFLKYSS